MWWVVDSFIDAIELHPMALPNRKTVGFFCLIWCPSLRHEQSHPVPTHEIRRDTKDMNRNAKTITIKNQIKFKKKKRKKEKKKGKQKKAKGHPSSLAGRRHTFRLVFETNLAPLNREKLACITRNDVVCEGFQS